MSLTTVCTACGARQPLEAGFVIDDAKLLADVCAIMDPVMARPALAYLRLFRPAKTDLRLPRAVSILRELHVLARSGRVSADERSALERPATAAMWAAGIEHMLANPPSGPKLTNHNYLRKVVYDLANKQDAVAERQVEQERSTPSGGSPPVPELSAVDSQVAWLSQQLRFGQISQAQYDAQLTSARTGGRLMSKAEYEARNNATSPQRPVDSR